MEIIAEKIDHNKREGKENPFYFGMAFLFVHSWN